MDWLQAVAVLAGNAAVVVPLWLHLETKVDALAKEGREGLGAHAAESRASLRQMDDRHHEMMRDFHGRLCAIEERAKNGQ